MIDLDALKASGFNSAEHSEELLRLHEWRERVAVTDALCLKFLRDNPDAGSDAFAAFFERVGY